VEVVSHIHIVVPVHSVKQGEGIVDEVKERIEGVGFPPFGIPAWAFVLVAALIVVVFAGWLLVGKGSGSHAGREEVRRSYRRQLAREMAKEDAAKIRTGEKPRRRWMQW
jgi:hypothetical protein